MKRVLRTILSATLLTGLIPAAGVAGTVVIDFDTDPFDDPIPSGTVIDSLYSSLGVVFSPTDTEICDAHIYASSDCSAPAVSLPNVVSLCAGSCNDYSEESWGLIRATLAEASNSACIDVVPAPVGSLCVIRAYDADHNLLGSTVSSGAAETLCVSVAGIRIVEFSGYQDDFGVFDNFAYESGSVPVHPSTFGGIKARYH